jgi:hypothetical protein
MIRQKILANWIMAPDGTMIPSMHRHDYRTHETIDSYEMKEGDEVISPAITRHSMADGGCEYLRRGGKFTEMSIYEDDPYEVIRRFVCRGGRGINLDQPLTYVPLFQMDNDWLKAVIEYEEENRPENIFIKLYKKELKYRAEHGIFIKPHL